MRPYIYIFFDHNRHCHACQPASIGWQPIVLLSFMACKVDTPPQHVMSVRSGSSSYKVTAGCSAVLASVCQLLLSQKIICISEIGQQIAQTCACLFGGDLAWEHTVVSVITWLASVALISIWSALVGERGRRQISAPRPQSWNYTGPHRFGEK